MERGRGTEKEREGRRKGGKVWMNKMVQQMQPHARGGFMWCGAGEGEQKERKKERRKEGKSVCWGWGVVA